jgi:hypothetical protein
MGTPTGMKLTRRKSTPQRVGDLLASFLKLKALSKTAKGARKAAKGTAAYKVAKKTPAVVPLAGVAGAGAVVLVAVKKLRGEAAGDPAV